VFILSCFLCIRCGQCLCAVPSVYSSVYFVLCLLYPMLPVSLCCSFLIVLLFTLVFILSCFLCIRGCQCLCVVPSVYSSVYCVRCLVYPMLSVSLCCRVCLLLCLFCLVSSVSDVTSVSVLFFLDSPFCLL